MLSRLHQQKCLQSEEILFTFHDRDNIYLISDNLSCIITYLIGKKMVG